MVFGVLAGVARVRITAAYAVVVTCVATALLILGPQVQDRVIRHASTNLHNLSHGHLGTLLGSAFVVDEGPIYVWLPGLICLLAVAELVWRSGRMMVAFVVGHVGATLVVAAWLTTEVEFGWLPVSISRAADVGMSYGAVAVLGSLTAAIPRRWRPAWMGWWLAIAVVAVAIGTDFTDTGHAVALVLGMLVSTRFGEPAPLTTARLVMFGVAAAFGFLVLANTVLTLMVAAGAGLLGAVALDRLASVGFIHAADAETRMKSTLEPRICDRL